MSKFSCHAAEAERAVEKLGLADQDYDPAYCASELYDKITTLLAFSCRTRLRGPQDLARAREGFVEIAARAIHAARNVDLRLPQ